MMVNSKRPSAWSVTLSALALAVVSVPAIAQSPASNKAFYASSETGIVFAPVTGTGTSPVHTVFSIPAALKTSSNGAVSAIVSLESMISTFNITTAINQGGKASSSSRAMLKVWVEVDGQPMEPGEVVYSDRLQATGLTLNLTCQTSTPLETCTVGGNAVLELFQQTKEANSFTFFLGNLGATIHKVEVKAQMSIECRNQPSGGMPTVIPCPTGTLAGYTNASTQAGFGKASILIEEQQNWGQQ